MPNTQEDNCIKLSFPVNAAYVSSARLTASSIANRMEFDIDEIEDIKTAVSEACTYIIKSLVSEARGNFDISFMLLGGGSMDIVITAQGVLAEAAEDDMSLMMIGAMMDAFSMDSPAAGGVAIHMTKKHKASIFN
jgi:serine/threonine-protein kinase RsbW